MVVRIPAEKWIRRPRQRGTWTIHLICGWTDVFPEPSGAIPFAIVQMVVRIPAEKWIRRPRQRVTDPLFGLFLLLCGRVTIRGFLNKSSDGCQ
jgi:hypothetical protein